MSTQAVTPAGQRTRDALLAAGVAVAEREGLSGLSVNRVVAEAGVAKGTFYVHFADRDAFVDALHRSFYERVSEAVAAAVSALPEGPERLLRGMEVYLDACLADRGIKALLLEARAHGAALEGRQAEFAALAEPSLAAMGRRDARVAARLLVAMTSEAALLELEAGRRLPAVRRSLRRLVDAAARADD